jgi:hypothetical protein
MFRQVDTIRFGMYNEHEVRLGARRRLRVTDGGVTGQAGRQQRQQLAKQWGTHANSAETGGA